MIHATQITAQISAQNGSEAGLLLNRNESLLLDDPEAVWLLESGTIALFTIAVTHHTAAHHPAGRQRYLFQVGTGELLMGLLHPDQDQGLLAVATEATQLRRFSVAEWMQRLEVASFGQLETWLHKLATILAAAFPVPGERYCLSPTAQPVPIKRHQSCQSAPDQSCWVQLQQGQATWMGLPELSWTDDTHRPLVAGIWLEAIETLELRVSSTAQLQPSQILAAVAQFQRDWLRCIALIDQRLFQADQQRFQAREALDRQVTEAAMTDLASILQPRQVPLESAESDLLVAAGAVGRALGIEIRPPARSDDLTRLKNPLEAIARASRVRLRRVVLTEGWWKQDCGALLAYTQDGNRPIALLPIAAGRYELLDPLQLTRTPFNATLHAILAPEAYTFYRSLPQAGLNAIDLLRFSSKGLLPDLAIFMATGILATLLGMLTPQATAIIIDSAIPDADRSLLLQVGVGLFAAACGVGVFRFVQGIAQLRLESLSEAATQAAIWDRLLNLSLPFFRNYATGDLEARVSAVSQIRRLISGTTTTTLFNSLFSLLNLGLLLYYNVQLALIAIGVALISITLTITSGVVTLRIVRPLEELRGKIRGSTVQLISGVSKLRVAAAEARAFAHWSQQYSQQQRLSLSTERIENALMVSNSLLPIFSSMLLFWFTVTLQQDSPNLSTGVFLAFHAAFGSFIAGATSLSNSVVSVLEIVALWERAKPILQAQPEVDASKTDPGRLSGKLAIDHVTFRYGQDGPITLDDVSLEANPGEFIALVGPSGSGKSTVLRLLLGFEQPQSGAVYYDGQDLGGLDLQAVRRQLGVVLQQSQVLSASIFENITGSSLISMDEAWWAARSAGLAADIEAMPMGMHTVVSEGGTNLSGGQKQRLLIARALALKPKLLLFDEATSALDNYTQSIVSESLDQLQVTRIVVAHRLSTIRNADRIYVLQAGRIVQQGNFETLSRQEGLFAKLIERQMA